jgi:zinc protease
MKFILSTLSFLIITSTSIGISQIEIQYEKYTLPNGLQVILHEDHSVPLISTNIWYHVGSAREKPRKTGFAHLFEHLMYEGSENVRDGRYDEIVDGSGGLNNGSTGGDRTNYWTLVPKNYLEPVLWLESDRMGYLLSAITQDRLDIQRDVVKNERRQNYENQPYGMANVKLMEALYPPGVPYHWMTIGSQEDLSAASLEDVKGFFRQFYGPNNASLCIGGDIDVAQTKQLVEKYFSGISKGPQIPKTNPIDVKLEGVKRLLLEDNVELPRLYIYWISDRNFGEDDAQLEVLSQVFSEGKNSRLYKSLVYEKKIAQEVYAFQNGMELNGYFGIVVSGKQDQSLKHLEKEVYSEINKIVEQGVGKRELDRTKNSIKASFIYRLQQVGGFGSKTDQLNFYNVFFGNPGKFNYDLERYDKVTDVEVKKVATKYLKDKPCVILSVVPKGKLELQAGE